MEKIEVFTKQMFVGQTAIPYFVHSYIIYTNNNGDKYILRGGPSETEKNGIFDKLEVIGADNLVAYTEATQTTHGDWDRFGTHQSVLIAQGSDLSGAFATMRQRGQAINNADYSYLFKQNNCHGVVADLLESAGLPVLFPASGLRIIGFDKELSFYTDQESFDALAAFGDTFGLTPGETYIFTDTVQESVIAHTLSGETLFFNQGEVTIYSDTYSGDIADDLLAAGVLYDTDIVHRYNSNGNVYSSVISNDGTATLAGSAGTDTLNTGNYNRLGSDITVDFSGTQHQADIDGSTFDFSSYETFQGGDNASETAIFAGNYNASRIVRNGDTAFTAPSYATDGNVFVDVHPAGNLSARTVQPDGGGIYLPFGAFYSRTVRRLPCNLNMH